MVDGDKSLVVADPLFVSIAERNMNGIVPLYYNMRKAEPTMLTPENIYAGLSAAFTGSNIGIYSNDISKIWNNDVFNGDNYEKQQEAIDVVKLLCMENNFVIDRAKTLYMPERPEWFKFKVSKYTNVKLPAFFEYAKDKEKEQIQAPNNSFVNKIYNKIPNKTINTRGLQLGILDYTKMMSDVNAVCSSEVKQLYNKLNQEYRYKINMKDEYINNLRYVACLIREEFSKLGYSNETITDMLIQYLYANNKRFKQLLWFCYGQYIVENLQRNIKLQKTKFIQCVECGEWIEIDIKNNRKTRCANCQKEFVKQYDRERKRKNSKFR